LNEQYECLDSVALLEELKNCKANCLNMLGATATLSKPQYDQIYDKAPCLNKDRDGLALITLQRRGDNVRARYSDLEDGVLQVKTEKHGYRAFLKIKSACALLRGQMSMLKIV
jgi:hypothetical protein